MPTMTQTTAQIPELSSVPLLGNITDIDPSAPMASFSRLANVHGEIFGYRMVNQHVIVVNSHNIFDSLCDENKFEKRPAGSMLELRNALGDGLFTAFNDEESWHVAHRILMPRFGPLATKGMFSEMYDIAGQMVSKWARQGPEQAIDPTNDFTQLTLDSIAICAMGTRFNSFYKDKPHPFVDAMIFFLLESGRRAYRPTLMNDYVYRESKKKYWESIDAMKAIVRQSIKYRREHPSEKADLLNAMMLGKDPKTGATMTEENVINNAITFMVAGHETTSGLLSFLFVLLLSNPKALQKAQSEVDRVIGKRPVTAEAIGKLPYITACLRETLRLWPPAPGFRLVPASRKDEDYPLHIGDMGYEVWKNDLIQLNFLNIHRDSSVYGSDAELFRPERMLDANYNKLPRNAWKPFGSGMRACIGKDFTLQESHIAVAIILQNFELRAKDPSYIMKYKQTLSIKPLDFAFYASLRPGLDATTLERRLWGGDDLKAEKPKSRGVEEVMISTKSPMTILYGSNAGTCESLANSLAGTASSHGYNPTVMTLDNDTRRIVKEQPLIIITPSYEGEPPDNATRFIGWLKNVQDNRLQGVHYAVFGCGNRDWASTFHKIPKFVNDAFEQQGATPIAQIGLSDVAENHVIDDFDLWTDNHLWPGLAKAFGEGAKSVSEYQGLNIEFQKSSRSANLRQDVEEAIVVGVKCLSIPGEEEKRHIEFRLPNNMTYTTGDYLSVLPMNPTKTVKAVMTKFGLSWDTVMQIKEGQYTTLPQGRNISAFDILSAYVELSEPITQKQLSTLATYTDDAATRSTLSSLSVREIASKRLSVFSLLVQCPAIDLSFGSFLSMLPPLHIRPYSISSSPLHSSNTCTLTYSILNAASKHDPAQRHLGVSSNYLSELNPGDRVHVAIRPSHQAFHPPLDAANTPILMICAGTGIAPFRAFVQQRAEQIDNGESLAPAILFIGCTQPSKDKLYADDFERWMKKDAVDVRYAFSRDKDAGEGCRYVQDRLWHDRDDARRLWKMGAKIYVCGSGAMAAEVGAKLVNMWVEGNPGAGREEGEAWLKGIRNERFMSDVFD